MSSGIKQLFVSSYDSHKRIMFLAKEQLTNNEKLSLIASTGSAPATTIAAENLVRLGYVTFENIQTDTEIQEGRRKIRLIITLKKTANFQKLFDENEKLREEKKAEREKKEKEKDKKEKDKKEKDKKEK